ncbi:MAG: PAS domain-containing sensor histidine kinase [Oscillospiraceae bacterium]|nr:PAS domain-containing sensor histidine kinase [Oscillospiraceae bacterium]MBQ9981127.1 PAS domain-containing sensor histidine kinase [Oscillospiraceae bacterium]
MTRRIFRSICTVAFVVFFTTLILVSVMLYSRFSDTEQKQLKIQTNLIAQAVSELGDEYFNDLHADDIRITWIDSQGTVIFDNKAQYTDMENHLEREEVQEALLSGYGESVRYSSTIMERSLYTAQRLDDMTVVRLSVVQSTIPVILISEFKTIFFTFLIAFVLSMFLASRLSKKIVDPINEINLDEPLSNKGYDEISPLLKRLDTQKKQLSNQKAELKQKRDEGEQMRREFTANVSHELKTPLHSISGYAELMKNGMVQQQDIIPFADKIYLEAQRMIKLVIDIINLSHLDEDTGEMKFEATDIFAVASETISSLSEEAAKNNIKFILKGDPLYINAIPQLLKGIVFNLCDNAVKYNKPNGTVTVEIEDNENSCVFSVADTGIGIPAEHHSRVFERFYRVDKSHSKEVGGTGLGLSIVKHSVRIHNADVKLDSVEGKGTKIVVTFPK